MTITVEAVYENGVLKPTEALALQEHQKVELTIRTPAEIRAAVAAVRRTAGMLKWTGDPEVLRRIAEDDEFSILESP